MHRLFICNLFNYSLFKCGYSHVQNNRGKSYKEIISIFFIYTFGYYKHMCGNGSWHTYVMHPALPPESGVIAGRSVAGSRIQVTQREHGWSMLAT
jgi:hypothetical protein